LKFTCLHFYNSGNSHVLKKGLYFKPKEVLLYKKVKVQDLVFETSPNTEPTQVRFERRCQPWPNTSATSTIRTFRTLHQSTNRKRPTRIVCFLPRARPVRSHHASESTSQTVTRRKPPRSRRRLPPTRPAPFHAYIKCPTLSSHFPFAILAFPNPPPALIRVRKAFAPKSSVFEEVAARGDGPYKADRPQVHRRQGPAQAARHQGSHLYTGSIYSVFVKVCCD
jgi:hypothetical protein